MQFHEITQSFIPAYSFCSIKSVFANFCDFSFFRQREYPCPERSPVLLQQGYQAFLERVLEQKSRISRRDPKCFRDAVGSFPPTFGEIWSSLRHISAQYQAHCKFPSNHRLGLQYIYFILYSSASYSSMGQVYRTRIL